MVEGPTHEQSRWRRWLPAVQTAEGIVVLGFVTAGVATSDPVISTGLMLAGLLVSFIGIWTAASWRVTRRLWYSTIAMLAFVALDGVVWYRTTSDPVLTRSEFQKETYSIPRLVVYAVSGYVSPKMDLRFNVSWRNAGVADVLMYNEHFSIITRPHPLSRDELIKYTRQLESLSLAGSMVPQSTLSPGEETFVTAPDNPQGDSHIDVAQMTMMFTNGWSLYILGDLPYRDTRDARLWHVVFCNHYDYSAPVPLEQKGQLAPHYCGVPAGVFPLGGRDNK